MPWVEVRWLLYLFFQGIEMLEIKWESWDKIDTWFKTTIDKLNIKGLYLDFQQNS